AVGLRGAAQLVPNELSGGMARRVALARAIALDPMLVMYDEPFAGLDPISLGIVGQLIRKLNDALGITSVVVTHDIYESLKIVDYIYFVSEGRIVAKGTPAEVRSSKDAFVRLFVGMVLGLQGYDALNKYGAGDSLGIFVGLSLVRELGPVVAGLLFASRAGSAVTAEIGLMKTTEQIAAMELMAVDPLARIVAPRFWGGIVSMPLLAALFSVLRVFGAYIVGVRLIGLDHGAFWGNMRAGIEFWPDVTNGIIKSIVFGIAVSLIAVFEGYVATPTAEGVSTATTRTVVGSSLA